MWVVEQKQLQQIYKNILAFKRDVAKIQGVAPRVFVNQWVKKVNAIEHKIEHKHKHSFFDTRIPQLRKDIKVCRQQINALLSLIEKSEHIAEKLVRQSREVTESMIHIFSPTSPNSVTQFTPYDRISHSFQGTDPFDSIKTSGANVWAACRARHTGLVASNEIQGFSGNRKNTLVQLLLKKDGDFVDAIDDGSLPIEGEIGRLILQRLKDIHGPSTFLSTPKNPRVIHQLNHAGKAIRAAMTASGDGILKCDYNALYIELTKLVLHAELHPNDKTFWLGTARAVIATIVEKNGQGTYLNCEDSKWTWHLNRIWIQTAIMLGFTCELVEQHFPIIEETLLSQDGGVSFIEALLGEVRSNADQTSQYNGYDSPTATTQEILVLLDLGCIPEKNPTTNRIYFSKRSIRESPSLFQPIELAETTLSNTPSPRPHSRTRSHSWVDGFPSSESPLKQSPAQFFVPVNSATIRRNTFKPVSNDQNNDTMLLS